MIITTKRHTDKNGNTYIYCYVGARKYAAYKLYDPAGNGDAAHILAAKHCFSMIASRSSISVEALKCASTALPDACNHDYVHEVTES